MRKQNILIALVLALTLILSASTMSTFAISGDTSGDQAQTVYNPNLTPESATGSGSGTLYNPNLRSGGSDEPDDQNDNEEPGTPDDPGDPNDPDDPDDPDDPPVAAHMLTGTVYEHSYAGNADTASPSEKEIKIKLADGTEKAVSGTFSLVWSEPVHVGSFPWSAVIIRRSSSRISFRNSPSFTSNRTISCAYPCTFLRWPQSASKSTRFVKHRPFQSSRFATSIVCSIPFTELTE